ncbi:MAG: hypothetical protein EX341_16460 [Candidatus Scalindua sp. SCAELEC01]|nr:MAG: hypothetical protein EX341_16460 [Candidatus Scalindua sp. SCAELEC01]
MSTVLWDKKCRRCCGTHHNIDWLNDSFNTCELIRQLKFTLISNESFKEAKKYARVGMMPFYDISQYNAIKVDFFLSATEKPDLDRVNGK